MRLFLTIVINIAGKSEFSSTNENKISFRLHAVYMKLGRFSSRSA